MESEIREKNWKIRTNHNILRVIMNFRKEDSLARTKFQQRVAGQLNDPNPGRTSRHQARLEDLKVALRNYSPINIKEYLFGLRGNDN